jgi:hypothetical protein
VASFKLDMTAQNWQLQEPGYKGRNWEVAAGSWEVMAEAWELEDS